MKFKIKIKTLIISIALALFLILILAPIVNLGIANYLSEKDSPRADMFYDNYMASPIKINKDYGLYSYGENLINGFGKYQIKFSGYGSEGTTTPENMDKAVKVFEDLLLMDKNKAYKGSYSYKSYVKLLDLSIARLDTESLLKWIDWGQDKEIEDMKQASTLYRAYYYFAQRDYDRSKDILDNYDGPKEDPKYYMLLLDINLHVGDIEGAREAYKPYVDKNLSLYYDNYEKYFGGNRAVIYKEDIEQYIKKFSGEYKVKGKVSYEGKGLAFVEVYIDDDIGVISTGVSIPDAITDKNGEFETLGLEQGVYDMGIALHPSQVYNKTFLKKDIRSIEINSDIEFNFDFAEQMKINNPKGNIVIKDGENLDISWETFQGADYYKVESMVFSDPKGRGGAFGSMPLEDENGNLEIKTNNMNLNISNLKKQTNVMYYSEKDELINPSAIYGSFIPGIEYPIIVNAYDNKDNLLGSSLNQIINFEDMSSIRVDKELTRGEQLILNKKYKEAIGLFENQLIDNPKDKEALLYLFRLNIIGWRMDEQDTIKALRYAQEYDKEYKDYDLLFEAVDLMGSSHIKENEQLIEEILEKTSEKDRDENYYYNKARYYLEIGNLSRARDSYDMIKGDAYGSISAYKIYIDIYLEDYDRAISSLENEDTKLMFVNSKVLRKALEDMDNISNQDKLLFKDLLKTILESNFNTKEMNALYKNILTKMDSKELKDAVSEIAKEEYFDVYYEDYNN